MSNRGRIAWIAFWWLALVYWALYLLGCAHTLPHRPMSEIDIQGHMELAPRRACPAVYDAPDGNLRMCL